MCGAHNGTTSVFDEPVALDRLLGVPAINGGPTLEPVLDLKTGRIVGYEEVFVDPSTAPGTATTSSSLQRDPAPTADWVRGQNTFRPFTPAGPADEAPEADDAAASLAADWTAGGDEPVAARPPECTKAAPSHSFSLVETHTLNSIAAPVASLICSRLRLRRCAHVLRVGAVWRG